MPASRIVLPVKSRFVIALFGGRSRSAPVDFIRCEIFRPVMCQVEARLKDDARVQLRRFRASKKTMAVSPNCYRRMRSESPMLIETYCAACGLLIGASPRSKLLTILENIHTCPVRGYYGDANGLRKPLGKVSREPRGS